MYIPHHSVTPIDRKMRIVSFTILPPLFPGNITSTIRDCVSYVLLDYWMSNERDVTILQWQNLELRGPDTTPTGCNRCGQCPVRVGNTEQKVKLLKQWTWDILSRKKHSRERHFVDKDVQWPAETIRFTGKIFHLKVTPRENCTTVLLLKMGSDLLKTKFLFVLWD